MIYFAFIAAYLVLMVVIGFFARKKARSADGFFIADRSRSTLLITGSLVATIIGGSATVGMAGLGFTQGLTGIWWLLAGSIGLIVLGLVLAEKVRGFALYTLPGLAEKQYGSRVGVLSSILIVISWIGVIAGQIIATGKIMSVLQLGTPEIWMILFTAIFVCYTLVGGQYADIGTDLAQAVLIFVGILAGCILVMIQVGGWQGLTSALPADSFSFPLSAKFGIMDFVSYILLIGLVYVVGPDMYSRIFSARDGKSAKKATLWAAVIIIPFAIIITLMGMGAAVLYPKIAPEQAFPTLLVNQFPPVLGALVMVALVSATMSSADSCVLSAGTILSVDIIKKMKPSLTERQSVLVAKFGIVVMGILALLLALYIKGVINALLFAYTVYTGGVIVPILAGFYKDKLRLNSAGAMAAIIGGGIAAVLSKLLNIKYLDVGALFISLALLFLISHISSRFSRSKPDTSS